MKNIFNFMRIYDYLCIERYKDNEIVCQKNINHFAYDQHKPGI
jgi:hypothetical protein